MVHYGCYVSYVLLLLHHWNGIFCSVRLEKLLCVSKVYLYIYMYTIMSTSCRNTTVEDFYKYSTNSTSPLGYYYLNNFSDLLSSAVTLFELTVVNNWFIVMDAYASVTNPYSRLFFMLFYLFTMVVLTIVVASVLEAFRFRIQYKKQTSKRDG